MKNVKVLLSALLVLVMLLGTTAALAEGYSVDVLEVKIWDNNQLAGLQQIADELFITYSSVHFHCKNIYRKLGISNRKQILIKYKDL